MVEKYWEYCIPTLYYAMGSPITFGSATLGKLF